MGEWRKGLWTSQGTAVEEANVRNEVVRGSEDDGYSLHLHLISRHKEGEAVESNQYRTYIIGPPRLEKRTKKLGDYL